MWENERDGKDIRIIYENFILILVEKCIMRVNPQFFT